MKVKAGNNKKKSRINEESFRVLDLVTRPSKVLSVSKMKVSAGTEETREL